MKRRKFTQLACAAGLAAIGSNAQVGESTKPNLLIIHTDEHNFRTLGCYRELLPEDQAFIWGKGVTVDTPNIDSIAHAGAICTSFYAASPVCTPSRASFVSGLYPIATGAPNNDMPMKDDIVTFAEILKRNGYVTSYVGKWHLDGPAKPGFSPKRKFGWADNRYMINRGHWKLLQDTPSGPALIGSYNEKTENYKYDITQATPESFTTDFLTDRALKIIDRDKAKPFCLMLAIPDPHGPNTVRAPYDTMYTNLVFQNPRSMDVDEGAMPGWVPLHGNNFVEKMNQFQMAEYFGMVKCIDDNVGKILSYLNAQGLDKNTIVVFTSDHGDLMGEHKRNNKGLPYETSAGVPFIIRYPGHILPGKVIDTAYITTDFAPTILSIMGADGPFPAFHGQDLSADFLSSEKKVCTDRIVYITNAGSQWVATVNHRYKLVLSPTDKPWLFDLDRDPDEITNFYDNPEYKEIVEQFKSALIEQMKRYNDPALGKISLTGTVADEKSAPALSSTPGYVVDTGDFSVQGKPGKWNQALSVPAGTFEPNSTYEMMLEWKSQGLEDGAEFFANFIGDKKDKASRQLKTWTGAAGETGVIGMELKTTDSRDWVLNVGVKGSGSLVVKRIQIKKK